MPLWSSLHTLSRPVSRVKSKYSWADTGGEGLYPTEELQGSDSIYHQNRKGILVGLDRFWEAWTLSPILHPYFMHQTSPLGLQLSQASAHIPSDRPKYKCPALKFTSSGNSLGPILHPVGRSLSTLSLLQCPAAASGPPASVADVTAGLCPPLRAVRQGVWLALISSVALTSQD